MRRIAKSGGILTSLARLSSLCVGGRNFQRNLVSFSSGETRNFPVEQAIMMALNGASYRKLPAINH